ncbi:hypothetical protein E4Q23_05840 [Candidatus Accumulibacter phosphatis]|uniref:Uncharacterized protein n=1 Tax=Candidatus Accumulibacter phosphatis TaxID=327160 RepID=A0ABX1TXB2_9PROT|nr:hypothetical protein [Candidatus Accumulibacter phosphatis]
MLLLRGGLDSRHHYQNGSRDEPRNPACRRNRTARIDVAGARLRGSDGRRQGAGNLHLAGQEAAGGGWGVGAQHKHKHKHSNEAWFMHRPSLKVVMRNRRPGRGKGLRARRSDNLRCGTKHPRPSLPPSRRHPGSGP